MQFFHDTGAWNLFKTKRDKLYVFQLGERKRGTGGYFVDTIYFNLSRNKARNFYKEEFFVLNPPDDVTKVEHSDLLSN